MQLQVDVPTFAGNRTYACSLFAGLMAGWAGFTGGMTPSQAIAVGALAAAQFFQRAAIDNHSAAVAQSHDALAADLDALKRLVDPTAKPASPPTIPFPGAQG